MTIKGKLSRSDFKLIAAAHFRREHGTFFSVSFGMLPGSVPKVACVVSKKTAARAVDRNLIKRRCRAAAQGCLVGVERPIALVFYAKRSANGVASSSIKEDIERLIKKALASQE